jgi:hypothetical protein
MATKMIPASELRDGYSLVLPDGSSRVIVGPPIKMVTVTLENGNIAYYSPEHLVAVVAEDSEF